MTNILINGKKFSILDFESEKEFEEAVIANSRYLFGNDTVYIDTKMRIGEKKSYHKTIPDGYLIDFTSKKRPQLYFVENKLSSHDAYSHIAEQILRFSTAIKTSQIEIRKKLIERIKKITDIKNEIEKFGLEGGFNNIDEIINYLVDNKIKIVVVIDEVTYDLNLSLAELRSSPDVVTIKRYWHKDEIIYLYDPMREEISDLEEDELDSAEEFDTIVCSALEEGFEYAYVERDAWWEIRLSQKAREKLKYLAIYIKSPIAEISHYAEIDKIEPYQNSGKYILHLKNKQIIDPIPLDKNNRTGVAPQAHRYTTFAKLMKAKKLSDLW
ncbi:MAG: hypothetical protein HZR80_18845 [Candidatus Heimdallarchaeota archaeon]